MNNSTLDLDKYEDKPKYFLTKDNRVFERRKNFLYFVEMPVQYGNWAMLGYEEAKNNNSIIAEGIEVQEMIIPNDLVQDVYDNFFKVVNNDSIKRVIEISIGEKTLIIAYSKIKAIYKCDPSNYSRYTRVWLKPELGVIYGNT